MFTTRLLVVGKHLGGSTFDLLPLSPDDSWKLLQRKVYGEQNCPSELVQTGMEVAEKCRGLPLAIIVIAGILKKTLTLPWWKQVAGSLSSIIAANDEVCMNTLALSYNHLPIHLKACFLHLGASFPEDFEIPVNKLILLWVAKGFVKQSGKQTLEAIAECYLTDLVGRNLVMVARKRPAGRGIKTCRIHDLLRELCLRKEKEDNSFWRLITSYSLSREAEMLRVLDLSSKCQARFPTEVVNFGLLRYLAIAARTIHLPPSISNLWNLETLILHTDQGTVNLPEMGNTTRLRHILVKSHYYAHDGRCHFENPSNPFSSWHNLQTLDGLCPCDGCLTFLKTTRNLKKLRICLDYHPKRREVGGLMFRDTPFSEKLEELKLVDTFGDNIRLDQVFPLSIKKLTLQGTYLHWKDMTIFGQLPRLEVLKLLHGAFVKGVWDTNDDEFRQLKYLKLGHVPVSEWNSCDEHFPKLETIVLEYLPVLEVLPSGFADLTRLEKIEVTQCHPEVDDFAKEIKEEYCKVHGDYLLEVLIIPRRDTFVGVGDMAGPAIEFFVENLERLISCSNSNVIMHEKEQLKSLHDDLVVFSRDFLKNSEEYSEVKNLIRDVAHKAETIVDRFTIEAFKHKDLILASKPGSFLDLGEVRKDIRTIKIELEEIYVKRNHEVEIPEDVAGSFSGGSSRQIDVPKLEGNMVGSFVDEATRIIQELADWQQRHLSIISIVGTAGAGKTTLAGKVYNHGRIREIFRFCGWIVVSQVYDKRDLLIDILKSTSLIKDGDCSLTYDRLGEELKKRLGNNRYLVVIDDIWSTQAWRDIQWCFPDDHCGSRVMFTTQLLEVADQITKHLHHVRPLSPNDSWELLQTRVFGKQSCPSELIQTGIEVAEKCGGLPLKIVEAAGILKKSPTLPWWKQVAGSLSSIIATTNEIYMDRLELSYNHLPLHLKVCFLYLGVFPENYEIPARKLIWLWIAEGFVKRSGEMTLEAEVAEGYLMDLVGKNLVMVTRKKSGGGIKACRIHDDLLRELCLRKAKEEYFLWDLRTSYRLRRADREGKSKHRRLWCIGDFNVAGTAPNLRTFLCTGDLSIENHSHQCSFSSDLDLLSVLDLSRKYLDHFPAEVVNFVHLRYLAIALLKSIHLPPSISNLLNLETLIFYTDGQGFVNLPEMGNTTRLRHILVKGGSFHFENPSKPFSSWDNLQTLDGLCACEGCLSFLKTTRNLKKLGIRSSSRKEDGCLMFRDEPFSVKLEELKLCGGRGVYCRNINQLFPLSIRKLTLRFTFLKWEDMTILGQLPCLEVLKLLDHAFEEGVWDRDTNDDEGQFCRLNYLKLEDVAISQWNSCHADFPNLETLVLVKLPVLEELPSDFAELLFLEKIEVTHCHPAMEDSARQIKEERFQKAGDDSLEVLITG